MRTIILPIVLVFGMSMSPFDLRTANCEAVRPSIEQVKGLFNKAEILPKHRLNSQSAIDFYVWRGPVKITYEPGKWIPDYDDTLLITVAALETAHCGGLVHNLIAIYDPTSQALLTPLYHYTSDFVEEITYHGKHQDFLLYVGGFGSMGAHIDTTTLFAFRKGNITATSPHADIQNIAPERRFVENVNDQLKILECSDEIVENANPCKYLFRCFLRWNSQSQKFERIMNKDQTIHP